MNVADYTLHVRTPVHKLAAKTSEPTEIPDGDITERVKDSWQRNKAWLLGDDIGTFSLYGPIWEMRSFYDNWLTFDVVEMQGGVATWNGSIVKMTLNWGMMPLTLDKSDMWNRVRATIGDGLGTYTLVANNAYSQQRYGLRSTIILPGVDTNTEAAAERDAFLDGHGWPSETPTGGRSSYRSSDMAELQVTVAGYGHSLNDLYADDVAITPSDGISATLGVVIGDSLYVNARGIATNATKLYDDVEFIAAGELVRKLLHVTDGSGNLFRGWIDGYRNFRYKAITNTPDYYIQDGLVKIAPGDEAVISPRLLQPGIYRNMDMPVTGPHRDNWFADRRDVWVDGVFVDRNGNFVPQPEKTSVSDYQTLYWSGNIPEAPVSYSSSSAGPSGKKKKDKLVVFDTYIGDKTTTVIKEDFG